MMISRQFIYKSIEVTKSFYFTFDGRRCYCNIPVLNINGQTARMLVTYNDGEQEIYDLYSTDGISFSGVAETNSNSRVAFEMWENDQSVVLSGTWKFGNHEGEWYIEGFFKDFPLRCK